MTITKPMSKRKRKAVQPVAHPPMESRSDYAAFLERKSQLGGNSGFDPVWMPDFLFDFQRALVEWAIRKGRAAIFADCLGGEAIINSPDGDVAIRDAYRRGRPLRVFSMDDGQVKAATASAPFVAGVNRLYRYEFASGRTIIATAGHRFFSFDGWKRGDSLKIGECLAVSAPCRLRSIADAFPLALSQDALRSSQTTQDSRARCLHDFRRCDAQPLSVASSDRALVPSPIGVPEPCQRTLHADALESRSKYTRRHQFAALPSTARCAAPASSKAAVAEFQPHAFGPTCTAESSRTSQPVLAGTSPFSQADVSHPSEELQNVVGRCQACQPCETSLIHWDTLVAVHYIRHDVYYDIDVRGPACFLADGIWSHNCGLGKTPMQLVWAENVRRHTGKPVLIMTPLAVSQQTQREADKFGIDCRQSRDGAVMPNITVTNYERLHHFNPDDFVGAVVDESSCLKAFDGKRRKVITRFMSKMPYRLLCTATPSPNDFIEMGTSSEALGTMTQSDMLSYFFTASENMRHTVLKEDDFWNRTKWAFKPHAEIPFWRWVCSWARACSRPEDLGFNGDRFKLPPLFYFDHVIDVPFIPPGEMFARPAMSLHEGRIERKRTISERCSKVREIVCAHDRQAIVWCHYNDEGDELTRIIPGAVQVAGSDDDDDKEQRLNDFALGNIRVLVTKPKIGCWGLNLQKCGDMTFFPSFSFEQLYQGVRRCWRFGREGPVNVHMVCAEGESGVTARLKIKQEKSQKMFQEVVRHMRSETAMMTEDLHRKKIVLPNWK